MTIHQKLRAFAENVALPHIMGLPFIAENADSLSILLVGSAATGLCTERSDVDICILCGDALYAEISKGTDWSGGKPSEIVLERTQLHYYAISYEQIVKNLERLEDETFYLYTTAVPLRDGAGLYEKLRAFIANSGLQEKRAGAALDMLMKRNRALKYVLENETDCVTRMKMAAEIIERMLRAAALCDGVPFDARKRLYQTALAGRAGAGLKPAIDTLIRLISAVSFAENARETREFLQIARECALALERR